MKPTTCYLCNVEVDTQEFSCHHHGDDVRLFCSSLHASYHFSEDKCLPWSIVENDQYGRYLVADRDIEPGIVISNVCYIDIVIVLLLLLLLHQVSWY